MLSTQVFETRSGKLIAAVGGFLAALALGLVLMVGPAGAVDNPPLRDRLRRRSPRQRSPQRERERRSRAGSRGRPDGHHRHLLRPGRQQHRHPLGLRGDHNQGRFGDGTWSWSFATNDGPAQSQTVTITATDTDNASATDTWTSSANCGANGTKLSETATSVTCRFPDGTKTSIVSVTSTDSDGLQGLPASQTVNIFNVQPEATFNQPTGPIDEGDSFELSLTDPSDPSSVDQASLEYAFDCEGDGTVGDFGPSSSTNCSPGSDGPGTLSFGAAIRDKDDFSSFYFGNVSVDNVAPTATINAPASVEEGRTFSVSLTNPSDPSSDDAGDLEYRFDCGSGFGAFDSPNSASCTAPSAPAQFTVKGQVRDNDGGVNEYSTSVAITDDVTKPTVLENSLSPVRSAMQVSRTTGLSATFSEPMAAVSLENPDHTSSTFKLQMFNKKTKKWKTIPATITLSNSNQTVTLDPFGATEGSSETLLAANKKFRGFITGGTNRVKDAAGNPLATNFIWTFNTGG